MRLATKTAVAVLVGVGALILVLGAAAERLVERSFGEIEADAARSHALTTKQNFVRMVADFQLANRDWAEWDEVAEFLAAPTKEWEDTNLIPLSFKTKGWHHLAIVDDRGEPGWVRALDDRGQVGPASPDFSSLLASGRAVFPAGSERAVGGFVVIDGRLSMFSSEPLRIGGKPPERPGAFLASQRLDQAWLERFSALTSTEVAIVLEASFPEGDVAGAWALLQSGEQVVVRRSPEGGLVSYVGIEDFTGRTVGLLAVRDETPMIAAARGVVSAVRLGLLAMGAVFCLAAVVLLRLGIVRRLRSVLEAMKRFGRGELVAHDAAGADEIADFATAFVEMRAVIIDRERAISAQAAAVQLVLDHSGSGMLCVTRGGRLAGAVSRAAREWLGDPGASSIGAYLFGEDERRRTAFEAGLAALRDRTEPDALVLERLPRSAHRDGRSFTFDYRVIEDQGESLVLIVIRDQTEAVALARREAEAREVHHLFARALRDRADFHRFLATCDGLLADVVEGRHMAERRRALRALRDMTAVQGVETVTAACDELAAVPAHDGALDGESLDRLTGAWLGALARFSLASPRIDASPVFVSPEEHAAMLDALCAAGCSRAIVEAVSAFEHAFSDRVLGTLAEAAHRTAARLEKEIAVSLRGTPLRIDRERTAAFWASLVHVVRNAADHGVEASPVQRETGGKPRVGSIELAVELLDEALVVTVADDGVGIDWSRVAIEARAHGLPHATKRELVDALFAEALTTKQEVTDLSGRGIGLSAVRAAVEALGGSCTADSTPGRGSRFTFSLPAVIDGRPIATAPLALLG